MLMTMPPHYATNNTALPHREANNNNTSSVATVPWIGSCPMMMFMMVPEFVVSPPYSSNVWGAPPPPPPNNVSKNIRGPLHFSNSAQKKPNRLLVIPPPIPGDTEPGPRQLIVNYLAPEVTSEGLRELFAPFGDVEEARVVTDPTDGQSRGFGFVYFKRHVDAARTIDETTGRVLLGKRVRVSYAIPQRPLNAADVTSIACTHSGVYTIADPTESRARRSATQGTQQLDPTS